MSDVNSTPSPQSSKPQKPYPQFPLYAHATKRWAKCIRGHVYYFGTWADPEAALREYEAAKAHLHAGRPTPAQVQAVTVKAVCNAFGVSKLRKLESEDICDRTYRNYEVILRDILKGLGSRKLVVDLRPSDFAKFKTYLAKQYGPVHRKIVIQTTRSAFKFAWDSGLLETPVRFGPDFTAPSAKTMRLHRAARGKQMFEAHEVLSLLDAATPQMRAMVLLALNAGFGNGDIGRLPISAVDLQRGWVDFPRPKTGIHRRCPLWAETVEALRAVIGERTEGLVFLTATGMSWHTEKNNWNPLSTAMRALLDSLKINGHRNFYALRHTFETIGGDSRDQVAVDFIMGHTPSSRDMSAVYRERVEDSRLRAVTEHIHTWLFGNDSGGDDQPATIKIA